MGSSVSKSVSKSSILKRTARDRIDNDIDRLIEFSHYIHSHPELDGKERLASRELGNLLLERGFSVEFGAYGLETAIKGEVGEGAPNIAICAEYDALPVVGHACGHNIISAATLGAAWALAGAVEELGCKITILGTPSEEGGGGKVIMLERGAFQGMAAAMMIHPWPEDRLYPKCLAVDHFRVHYHGREAHASAAPHEGINAADALVVAQVAIGLLRQSFTGNEQIHGIVEKGGDAPNIIPSHTTARYMVRASTIEELRILREKVDRCFEAGAVATGSDLEIEMLSPTYSELRTDPILIRLWESNATALGRDYSKDANGEPPPVFSTDMGNVSLAVPSIHPLVRIDSNGASNHQPAFALACASETASRAIYDSAVAMAWTVIDFVDQIRNSNPAN